MSATQEDDAQTYLVLGLAVGVITLVLLLVLGLALSRGVTPAAPAAVPAAAVPAASLTPPDGAGIRAQEGVVVFYFASGSTDLPAGAAEALTPIIGGVGAGRKARISGFHDATGNAEINAELAQRRAQAVRDVLTGLGAPPGQVLMQKPESSLGTGGNAQARRVEVRLVD